MITIPALCRPTFESGPAQQWVLLDLRRLPGSDTVALHCDCQPRRTF